MVCTWHQNLHRARCPVTTFAVVSTLSGVAFWPSAQGSVPLSAWDKYSRVCIGIRIRPHACHLTSRIQIYEVN
jgi:hypothetical protein